MEIVTDGPALVLSGDFDVRSTFAVRTALYDLLSLYDEVIVDLTDVRSVDVTALRLLAVASRVASREGQRVTLRGCNGAVRRLLHMTHLIRLVDLDRQPVPA